MNGDADGHYGGDVDNVIDDGFGGFKFEVPLGYPSVPFYFPRINIPDLGKLVEILFPTPDVPPPFIGTIESPLPPHEEPIVDVVLNSISLPGWIQTRDGKWKSVTDPSSPSYVPWSVARLGLPQKIPPAVKTPVSITPPPEKTMDLGSIITDLFGTYIDYKTGPQLAPPPGGFTIPAGPDYSRTPPGAGGSDPLLTPALGFPGFDVTSGDSPGKGWVWNPTANCGTGKWQKKSRRRRRRLATAGDIKDIAALKNVAGPAFLKTWVATHPA